MIVDVGDSHHDAAISRELEGIGGEIEQDTIERARMTKPKVANGTFAGERKTFLFRDGQHDVAYRLENVCHRKRLEFVAHQTVAASYQLDHVTRNGIQPERRRVDQPQLPLLGRSEGAAPSAEHGLGEEKDRRQRRAKVMGNLYDQVEAAGPAIRC